MNFQNVTLKVGNMRKEQEFTIYPNGTSPDYILIQSDKRMAILMKESGKFFITKKNYNYPTSVHLQIDRMEVELSNEDKEAIRRGYNAMSNGKNGIIKLFG